MSHEHKHEHHHEGECHCGHHHEHDHHDCGCHHEHHHHDLEHTNKKIYILENLGCAHCASRMEEKIQQLPGVHHATLTYATKQLAVVADHPDELLPEIRRICTSIESEVIVKPKAEKITKEVKNESSVQEYKGAIIEIAAGAIAFVAGIIVEQPLIYVAAYLLLGRKILWTALKNIAKGKVFDENFLMSIATIGAFAIGEFTEAVGVMLFYRVGELFEDIAVARSRASIMETVDLRPEVVNLIHGNHTHETAAEKIKAGDMILVRPGDRIPLDGIVVEGNSQLDTSAVTGEPVPRSVAPGEEIYSGCVNLHGVLKIQVTKVLSESMVSRILDSVENAAANKPKIDRFITRFAKIYTPAVVLAAIATAVIPSLITGEWNYWIYTAITFLVISCPCALVLSVPLAFFSGIGGASRAGILFKGGMAIEALSKIKAVAMDKTGTMTKGNFVVQNVKRLGMFTEKQILTMAADCELISTHPIGKSIVEEAKKRNYSLVSPTDAQEFSGKGIYAVFPEAEVLCGNEELLRSKGVQMRGYVSDQYGTKVLLAVNGRLEGEILIADVIKEDSLKAIEIMKKMCLATVMLTGDSKESANAVGDKVGVAEIHAGLFPEEKLEHLQKIRKAHGEVLFVGDGINDAPVLAGADVGAAMGSGADAAIEAADVVFMNASLEAVPMAVQIARKTGKIAKQNVIFALAVKALVMILGFAGLANMWMAVFADTGVAMICVMNSIRAMKR